MCSVLVNGRAGCRWAGLCDTCPEWASVSVGFLSHCGWANGVLACSRCPASPWIVSSVGPGVESVGVSLGRQAGFESFRFLRRGRIPVCAWVPHRRRRRHRVPAGLRAERRWVAMS